jgi:hypothetical protein
MLDAKALSFGTNRPLRTRRYPVPESALATAEPMPPVAPEITATLFQDKQNQHNTASMLRRSPSTRKKSCLPMSMTVLESLRTKLRGAVLID